MQCYTGRRKRLGSASASTESELPLACTEQWLPRHSGNFSPVMLLKGFFFFSFKPRVGPHSLSQAPRYHLPSLPSGQGDEAAANPPTGTRPQEAAPTPGSAANPISPCPALPPLLLLEPAPSLRNLNTPHNFFALQTSCEAASMGQGKDIPPGPQSLFSGRPRHGRARPSPVVAKAAARAHPAVLGGIGSGCGHVSMPRLHGQANQLEHGGTRAIQWF